MSKRIGANFSNPPTGHRHYTRPKTPAEEFMSYLQSLGYTLGKYSKPEHYEHLFQDKQSTDVIRWLMKNVKPSNIVGKEELKQFKALESKGQVLYGAELEDAIKSVKAREAALAENDETELKKGEELELMIQMKKDSIERLERLEAQVDNMMAMKKRQNSVQNYDDEVWIKKAEYFDNKILAQRAELAEKIEVLNSSLDTILRHLKLCSEEPNMHPLFFAQIFSSSGLINQEEALMSSIRSLVANYGTDLIESEHNEPDPLFVAEINRIFNENVSGLQRLRHVIVYEAIRNLELTTAHKVQIGLEAKMGELKLEAERISKQEKGIQKKMMAEIHRKTELLQSSVDELEKRKTIELSTVLGKNLDEEMKALQDVKKVSKGKVDNFFQDIIEVMVSQRSRLEIGGYLLKLQTAECQTLEKQITKFGAEMNILKELSDYQNIQEPQSSLLTHVLSILGISVSVLQNPVSAWSALASIQHYSEFNESECWDSGETQLESGYKKLQEVHVEFDRVWESLRTQPNPEDDLIKMLGDSKREAKLQLSNDALNRECAAEEAIELRRSHTQNINIFLANLLG